MAGFVLCASVVLLLCWTSVSSVSVFSSRPEAHALLRAKRANSFLEELKPGNQERECNEEICDFEEAREIFQTREATLEFWTRYIASMTANCSVNNGDCDHDCTEIEGSHRRTCNCIKGYRLDDNGKTCAPIGRSSCGQLLISRTSYDGPVEGLLPWMVGGEVGKKGESPWQALLLNARGRFHCGGVLIDENWVLTAAHCLEKSLRFKVRLGDYERFKIEGTEETLAVDQNGIFKHPNYTMSSIKVDNDIALLRLATPAPLSNFIVPACLPSRSMAERVLHLNGTVTVVTGWGEEGEDTGKFNSALNVIKVPLVDHSTCASAMTHNITDNVLCAGILGQAVDACKGDSGGPMVTLYRDTWFLVGLVSWGEGCGKKDKLGIYTKVSNYNDWIDQIREDWDKRPQTVFFRLA